MHMHTLTHTYAYTYAYICIHTQYAILINICLKIHALRLTGFIRHTSRAVLAPSL